jgi:hypothetical protein
MSMSPWTTPHPAQCHHQHPTRVTRRKEAPHSRCRRARAASAAVGCRRGRGPIDRRSSPDARVRGCVRSSPRQAVAGPPCCTSTPCCGDTRRCTPPRAGRPHADRPVTVRRGRIRSGSQRGRGAFNNRVVVLGMPNNAYAAIPSATKPNLPETSRSEPGSTEFSTKKAGTIDACHR